MTILVVGATGTQGGAVVEHLLGREGFTIHALTRDATSGAARALADRGVEVIEGDMAEKNTIRPLVEEADGVFCVTSYWEAGGEREVELGVNMAEVAADEGVDHFVFSSVGGAERDTGIPHFETKHRIEERIRDLGLPATVFRPVYFMGNFEGQREQIEEGMLAMPLAEGVSLQMLDPHDIGAFVARAFEHPDRYVGEAIELAGDEHTVESAAAVFSSVLERDVDAYHLTPDDLREEGAEEAAVMFEWFNEHGFEADIGELGRQHDVELTVLDDYLRAHGWAP